MEFRGLARTETEILNLSVLTASGLKGIVGVAGITELGEPNKPQLVGTWTEYQKYFGGLIASSIFPLLCKRALESGARLRVSRVAHYADIEDTATISGVKASATLTGGVSDAVTATAVAIGAWGNKVRVTIANTVNGIAGNVDIRIVVEGFDASIGLFEEALDVSPLIAVADLNARLKLVQFSAVVNRLPIASGLLAGGEQVIGEITAVDYIGSEISNTGVRAFDNFADVVYISVPEKADPVIDAALANYADMRTGIIALLRAPVGTDGYTAVDYRNGAGIYSHAAIDSWRTFMTFGGLKAKHPQTLADIEVTELANLFAILTKKDTTNREWFSFSGEKRGKIAASQATDVVYNLASPARRLEAAAVDAAGLNPFINHSKYGVVSWGNGTLHRGGTILKHANVAMLLVHLERILPQLTEVDSFDPNDIETWKAIYRRVKPVMDDIQTNRGVWKWRYEGDQDIDHISQATVNNPAQVDEGGYVFRLWVAPKVGMKYIGIQIAVTNSNAEFTLLGEGENA